MGSVDDGVATSSAGLRGAPNPAGWAATAAVGLGLVAVTLFVSSAHLLAVDALRGPVVVLPVIGAVCLAAALAARRGTRRSLIAALVVAMLVTLGNLAHLVDTLGLPSSPWDFAPNLAAVVGLVIAVPSLVAALLDRRTTRAMHRAVIGGALVVVGIGTTTSLVLASAEPSPVAAGDVVVETVANEFAPTVVEVLPGDAVVISNLDPYGHTFTVEDLRIDLGVAGNDTGTVTIPATASLGEHQITCVLHPEIMLGTLRVTDG